MELYNVSIELEGNENEIIPVKYFKYTVLADNARFAISRAFEEIYKEEENHRREVLVIHVNKIDILRA